MNYSCTHRVNDGGSTATCDQTIPCILMFALSRNIACYILISLLWRENLSEKLWSENKYNKKHNSCPCSNKYHTILALYMEVLNIRIVYMFNIPGPDYFGVIYKPPMAMVQAMRRIHFYLYVRLICQLGLLGNMHLFHVLIRSVFHNLSCEWHMTLWQYSGLCFCERCLWHVGCKDHSVGVRYY